MSKKRYTVQQLVENPSFVKWARGESGSTATEYWNEWVKQDERNRKNAILAQKKITGIRFQPVSSPNLKSEWNRVKKDIEGKKRSRIIPLKPSTGSEKALQWMNMWFRVAAFLLVGIFVGVLVYSYQQPTEVSDLEQVTIQTVSTDYETKKSIYLPDGSKIMLAAGSQLSYESNWLEKPVQQVQLQGEAYFSISPDTTSQKQPKFVVKTEDGIASVWGTKFTINTYNAGTQVVLEEGEVRVNMTESEESREAITKIYPGEMATLDRTKAQIQIKKVNPAVYTSWTTEELYFDDTPFSVLVNRIERTYGVEVIIRDPKISDMRLSGSIDFRSLDGLISAVSKVVEVSIKKTQEQVIIG